MNLALLRTATYALIALNYDKAVDSPQVARDAVREAARGHNREVVVLELLETSRLEGLRQLPGAETMDLAGALGVLIGNTWIPVPANEAHCRIPPPPAGHVDAFTQQDGETFERLSGEIDGKRTSTPPADHVDDDGFLHTTLSWRCRDLA